MWCPEYLTTKMVTMELCTVNSVCDHTVHGVHRNVEIWVPLSSYVGATSWRVDGVASTLLWAWKQWINIASTVFNCILTHFFTHWTQFHLLLSEHLSIDYCSSHLNIRLDLLVSDAAHHCLLCLYGCCTNYFLHVPVNARGALSSSPPSGPTQITPSTDSMPSASTPFSNKDWGGPISDQFQGTLPPLFL